MDNPTTTRTAPVKAALTPKRRNRPVVENGDYAAFCRRVIRAQARRIAAGDIEELANYSAWNAKYTAPCTPP